MVNKRSSAPEEYALKTFAEVEPISEDFGADVAGMDLSGPIDKERQAWLRGLLDTYHLLRFRGQPIAPEVHMSVLASFGPLLSTDDGRGYYYISNIETVAQDVMGSNGSLLWHSDFTWSESRPQVLSLYGETVEAPVAPTLFTCATTVLDRMPPALGERIQSLSAKHTSNGWTARFRAKDSSTVDMVWPGQEPLVRPLVSKNPRTQTDYLCVSQQHTQQIVDVSEAEGEALLAELFQQLYDPQHVIVHEWANNDLVVWDNIALQHSRPEVSASAVRHLRKVNAGGSIPVRQFELASRD